MISDEEKLILTLLTSINPFFVTMESLELYRVWRVSVFASTYIIYRSEIIIRIEERQMLLL